jgi:hypothetical protein
VRFLKNVRIISTGFGAVEMSIVLFKKGVNEKIGKKRTSPPEVLLVLFFSLF